MTELILTVTAVVLYLTAGTGLALRLAGFEAAARARPAFLAAGVLGVAAHAVLLYHTIWHGDVLNLDFFNAASLIAWLMAALILVSALRRPTEDLGIVIMPLAAITLTINHIVSPDIVRTTPFPPGVDAHIFFSVVAYSILAIAALQSVVLAAQDYQLRHKHPNGFIRMLPPLQTMEDLLFQMLTVGFAMLTLALATGMFYLDDIFAQHLVHKTVLSIVAWLLFGTLLWGRWRFGWRGPKAIRWTLGGFFALMLAYFGSKLVLEFILHR